MSKKKNPDFRELPIDQIRSSPLNPRKIFDPQAITELAESIKDVGLIEPITVRPVDDKYEIVVGERRYRASKQAGLKSVLAVIRSMPDEKALELMLVENIQREDLQPVEEALTFQKLIEEYGYTQNLLASIIKKTQQYISRRLVLLELPEEVQEKVVASPDRQKVKGAIPAESAYQIQTLKSPERQKDLATKVIQKGSTQAQVRADIKKAKQIDRILNGVQNPEVRVALREELEPKLFNDAVTIKKVEEQVQLATKGFIVQLSFEKQWRNKTQGMRSMHGRFPETSFVRGWEEGDRHYFMLVTWMDTGEKVPTLIRKDYAIEDFATHREADNYAKERGGYCSGKIRIRDEEYWCVYEREDP